MTFKEIQDAVYQLMRDPNSTKYTLSFIKQWINAGEKLFNTLTDNYYDIDISTSTTVDVTEYDLPADYGSDIAVYYDDNELVEIDPVEGQESGLENMTPRYYYIKNDKVILVGSVLGDKELKFIYYGIGGVMTDDLHTPKIAAQYHLALVYFACFHCCIEGDDTREARFDNLFSRMVDVANGKVTDERYGNRWPVIGESSTESPFHTDRDLYEDR